MEDIEYFCNTVVIKKKVMLFQKMFNFTKKLIWMLETLLILEPYYSVSNAWCVLIIGR